METKKTPLLPLTLQMFNPYRKHCTHAITLTMKQSIWVMTKRGRACIKLTPQRAQRNLSHALNRLNRYFYGNGYKRKPDQYAALVIPVLHGLSGITRLHYHLQIGNLPENTTYDDLHKAVTEAWSATDFGDKQIKIQDLYGTRWLPYMMREIYKKEIDCVDMHNLNIPQKLRTD
jgi:hypothetical protein